MGWGRGGLGVRTEKVEVLLCAANRGSAHPMCWNCRNHYVRVTVLESRTQKRKFLYQGIGMQKFYVQLVPFSIVLSLTVANYRLLITFVNRMFTGYTHLYMYSMYASV